VKEKKLKVLHLEDNELDAELIRATLESGRIDCEINRVTSKHGFEEALRTGGGYDVILSDFSLPGFDGLAALSFAKQITPEVPFLFVSGTIGEDRAVESLKLGAADYVVKDRLQRLGAAITRARDDSARRQELTSNLEQIRCQAELLNQAKDAIFTRNLDQEITYWNKSAEHIYGWTTEEAIGKRASEILDKQGSANHHENSRALLEKGEWTGELEQVTKSGKEIIVSSHRTLVRDSSGNPIGVLNINTDITDKKELEAQVLRSQRMDSIGALAGGIAHDLNNMLAPILMVTELLRTEVTDPEHIRFLTTASQSARRGADLVKQILQFARGAKGQIQLIDLKALAEELVRFISKTFPRSIQITLDTAPDLTPVKGDATQLHQILLNLCVNARDAMERGGALSIRIKNIHSSDDTFPNSRHGATGSFVEISIADTGAGMLPEVQARIFDPFFTTKKIGSGTGLGLSTVATIVRNHKGFLTVDSAVDQGTTFRVFLPVSEATARTIAVDPPAAPLLGRGEWILLVDDELALLEITKGLLEACNYKVLVARNGAEALRLFDENHDKIAVVITDLMMPELGGEELIIQICDRMPNTPTICLSGSADETTVFRKSAHGPTTFLRKPCSTATLLKALDKLLENRRSGSAAV
jgi:PAS domain S-box-containing protein